MYLEILAIILLLHIYDVKSGPQGPPDPSDPIGSINWLIKMKQKTRPYEKFGFTYGKITSCGLRYVQKRGVCERFFLSKRNKLKLLPIIDDYPDLSCKSVEMDVTDLEVVDNNPLYLSMYECPNPYKIEPDYSKKLAGPPQKSQQWGQLMQQGLEQQRLMELSNDQQLGVPVDTVREKGERFFMPLHFLITGGVYPNSIIVAYRHVSLRRRPVKFHTVILNFPVGKLNAVDQLQRNLMNRRTPSNTPKKFTKRKAERVEHIVGPVRRSVVQAEGRVCSSELFKRYNPYKKFQANYDKINICPMTREDKLQLCRQVFENDAYRLSVSEIQDGAELVCRRQKVSIVYSYSEFQSVQVALMKCPTEGTTNSYFLAAVHNLWNLVAFMQIPPFVEILPDAVLTVINPEKLKRLPGVVREKLTSIDKKKNKVPGLAVPKRMIISPL